MRAAGATRRRFCSSAAIGIHHGRSHPVVSRGDRLVRDRVEFGSPRSGDSSSGIRQSPAAGSPVADRECSTNARCGGSRPSRLRFRRVRRVGRIAAGTDLARHLSSRRCSRPRGLDEHPRRQQSRTRRDGAATALLHRIRQRSLVLRPRRGRSGHRVASGSDRSPSMTVGNCNSTCSSSRSRRFTHRLLSRLRSGASAAHPSNCGGGAPTFSANAA